MILGEGGCRVSREVWRRKEGVGRILVLGVEGWSDIRGFIEGSWILRNVCILDLKF